MRTDVEHSWIRLWLKRKYRVLDEELDEEPHEGLAESGASSEQLMELAMCGMSMRYDAINTAAERDDKEFFLQ